MVFDLESLLLINRFLVYGAMVAIVIMSLYVLFKTIGLNQMFSMGIGGLLKITLFFAYLGLFWHVLSSIQNHNQVVKSHWSKSATKFHHRIQKTRNWISCSITWANPSRLFWPRRIVWIKVSELFFNFENSGSVSAISPTSIRANLQVINCWSY